MLERAFILTPMTPEQLGQAAYEAHHYRLERLLSRTGKKFERRAWQTLAPMTRECWIVAALEVVYLTRPRDEVLAEAAQAGLITVRVTTETPSGVERPTDENGDHDRSERPHDPE